MDNYLLSSYRRISRGYQSHRPGTHMNRNGWSKISRHHWRQKPAAAHQRWLEAISPESLNMFLGLHGPNKIPKIRDHIRLRIEAYLEVSRRDDPNIPPVIHSLGDHATVSITGIIEIKQLVDKKRNLYKAVVYVVQNDAACLGLKAPEGYEGKLPFYKQRIFCPLAGARFHMYYAVPCPQGLCQGVISKIYANDNSLAEQYVPLSFRP